MTDDLAKARQRRQRRQAARSSGPPSPRQAMVNLLGDAAAERRDPAAYYADKTPTPERITTALNLRMLYGPEVDEALGGEEPMVDEWESGERVPTFEQMQRLALLTGFPVRFFYQPPAPQLGDTWLCGPGGCETLAAEDSSEDAGRLF